MQRGRVQQPWRARPDAAVLGASLAQGLTLPDAVLVRKSYEDKRRRRRARGEQQRPWKLKRMAVRAGGAGGHGEGGVPRRDHAVANEWASMLRAKGRGWPWLAGLQQVSAELLIVASHPVPGCVRRRHRPVLPPLQVEVGEEEAGGGAPHRGRGVSAADQQAADMERFLQVRPPPPCRPRLLQRLLLRTLEAPGRQAPLVWDHHAKCQPEETPGLLPLHVTNSLRSSPTHPSSPQPSSTPL